MLQFCSWSTKAARKAALQASPRCSSAHPLHLRAVQSPRGGLSVRVTLRRCFLCLQSTTISLRLCYDNAHTNQPIHELPTKVPSRLAPRVLRFGAPKTSQVRRKHGGTSSDSPESCETSAIEATTWSSNSTSTETELKWQLESQVRHGVWKGSVEQAVLYDGRHRRRGIRSGDNLFCWSSKPEALNNRLECGPRSSHQSESCRWRSYKRKWQLPFCNKTPWCHLSCPLILCRVHGAKS